MHIIWLLSNKTLFFVLFFISIFAYTQSNEKIDVGVYYFPGWHSNSEYWNDIKGLPNSRSHGISWAEREPLLGYYPEEEIWVAKKHIKWAKKYKINFFAFDTYWNGTKPYLNHAIDAFLNAKNSNDIKFCLMWANDSSVPNSLSEYEKMIDFWIKNYLNRKNYYKINNKPVIFVFSWISLRNNSTKFNYSIRQLFDYAENKFVQNGLVGAYFVLITGELPEIIDEVKYKDMGFSAYTGWNYVNSIDKLLVSDYESMVNTYDIYYKSYLKSKHILPYIFPASPGWDSRPWQGKYAYVRSNSTPEKFKKMLLNAKNTILNSNQQPKILMIEAWNEFGEGAFIEPTKKYRFKYLQQIRNIFR